MAVIFFQSLRLSCIGIEGMLSVCAFFFPCPLFNWPEDRRWYNPSGDRRSSKRGHTRQRGFNL